MEISKFADANFILRSFRIRSKFSGTFEKYKN